MENHKPIQREDGSVYCYCDKYNTSDPVSVSLNWLTKKMMCSVCGKEMDMEE
jgi:hypothetical protein